MSDDVQASQDELREHQQELNSTLSDLRADMENTDNRYTEYILVGPDAFTPDRGLDLRAT